MLEREADLVITQGHPRELLRRGSVLLRFRQWTNDEVVQLLSKAKLWGNVAGP